MPLPSDFHRLPPRCRVRRRRTDARRDVSAFGRNLRARSAKLCPTITHRATKTRAPITPWNRSPTRRRRTISRRQRSTACLFPDYAPPREKQPYISSQGEGGKSEYGRSARGCFVSRRLHVRACPEYIISDVSVYLPTRRDGNNSMSSS